MLPLAAIPKQRAQKLSVVLQNLQLGMQHARKPWSRPLPPRQLFAPFHCMQALNLLVVGRYNRFLTREVVISRSQRDPGSLGNVSHGRRFKALPTKQFERFLKD